MNRRQIHSSSNATSGTPHAGQHLTSTGEESVRQNHNSSSRGGGHEHGQHAHGIPPSRPFPHDGYHHPLPPQAYLHAVMHQQQQHHQVRNPNGGSHTWTGGRKPGRGERFEIRNVRRRHEGAASGADVESAAWVNQDGYTGLYSSTAAASHRMGRGVGDDGWRSTQVGTRLYAVV